MGNNINYKLIMMSIGSGVGGVYYADNALTCDSEGNCMLKDQLIKIGGSIGGVSASMKFADNSLTCDSEGNCMLKDELTSLKDQVIASHEQRYAKVMAQIEAGVPAETIKANAMEKAKTFVGDRTLK